jgi:tryptophan synthase beta chain
LGAIGRAEYPSANDGEVLEAFKVLSQTEGIIPALEPSHALAWIMREAGKSIPKGSTVLMTLSGRGDKDVALVHKLMGS